MDAILPILAIGGFIVFIGGIIYIAHLIEKKRTEAMTAYAQQHGFVFEGPSPQLLHDMGGFKLFNQGHSRQVKNFMRGSKDVGAIRIADYQYVTGSGKHRTVWSQTIVILQTPGRNAPHFFCRRQRALFDALGKMFGGQDINFDDDPVFSKAYVLQTSGDENQLRHFMSPGLRDTLTRMSDKNLVLEVSGDTLLLHHGRQLKPEQIDGLIADAVNVRRNWS
ncbi:MAG: hypothetical protein JNM17_33475 [Archangium sp.]|nr:hypothetical protein [Archangium sp.]